MSTISSDEDSLLSKLDASIPAPLAQFDAFPKLPSSYKARSQSRGVLTVLVSLITLLMMLNDMAEFIWGWPDHEFSVDAERNPWMTVNVDLVVAMPCRYLSVDLRDALGDRLFLSGGLRRDGTLFDSTQATKLKEHSAALSVRQAIKQSRSSRGFFSFLTGGSGGKFKPTYNYKPHGSACRIWGSLQVKKVTANLHITALGHGYQSNEHVPHGMMNLSHVITEFSFGPFFPDITQPLDNSYEATHDPFTAYQYFLHVVPTTYIPPRSNPLHTNQYSVTHYTRKLSETSGTPGIFFKYELDPLSLSIHQRTTSFPQFLIRIVGVIGGVFVCCGYAIRIGSHAVEVVTGKDPLESIPASAAEASGVKVGGLRAKWGGSSLRSRPGKMVRQGSGWVMESSPGSPLPPYTPSTPYTPASAAYSPNLSSGTTNGVPPSPYVPSSGFPPSPVISSSFGPISSPMGIGPPIRSPLYANSGAQRTPRTPHVHVRSPSLNVPLQPSTPGGYGQSFGQINTPLTNAGVFPPTPQVGSGFNIPAIPGTPQAGSSFNIPPAPGTPGTPSFGNSMAPPPVANKRMSMPPPSTKKDD